MPDLLEILCFDMFEFCQKISGPEGKIRAHYSSFDSISIIIELCDIDRAASQGIKISGPGLDRQYSAEEITCISKIVAVDISLRTIENYIDYFNCYMRDRKVLLFDEIINNQIVTLDKSPIKNVCARMNCPSKGKTKKCGKCQSIRYCSEECQRIDWKRHKLECKV